jgi:hypothetical protein
MEPSEGFFETGQRGADGSLGTEIGLVRNPELE